MIVHPAQLLILSLLGLVALAIFVIALYLLNRARTPRVTRVVPANSQAPGFPRRDVSLTTGPDRSHRRALTALALLLLAWVFAGKYLVALFYPHSDAPPQMQPLSVTTVRGASGADLRVSSFGRADAPTLLLTHGWGADSRYWRYALSDLATRYHVVTWDLPGLGASSPQPSYEYSVASLARDLNSVIDSLNGRPLILGGHSIGGMMNLEYARLYPARMGTQVRGLVELNTTFTNPIETKKNAERSKKMQAPVLEPLLRLVEWTSPIARGLGWFAYQSGLAHLQLAKQSFAGAQSWDQLDLMARYAYRSSPRVIASGVLGMLAWDGSDVLGTIKVPALIVSGEQDVTTLPAASDRMGREIPASVRVSVAPAAHLGPVEQYHQYARAIHTFVERASTNPALAAR